MASASVNEKNGGRRKVAFVTCVQLGLSCIRAVLAAGGHFDLLITLKDQRARDKSGRIYLDEVAGAYGIPLLKVDSINDAEAVQAVRAAGIDWMFVIGWSQIVKPEMLYTPHCGCVGIHPTLLPEGRGRAPIPWAILKGLPRTGVTMFRLDEGVDTGPVIAQIPIDLTARTTATELYEKVNRVHVELMLSCWADIVNGRVTPVPQDEDRATRWPVRRPADGALSHRMTMAEADRLVRAVTHPYPGAFFEEDGQRTVVWSADIGREHRPGAFRLADGYLYPLETERQMACREPLVVGSGR